MPDQDVAALIARLRSEHGYAAADADWCPICAVADALERCEAERARLEKLLARNPKLTAPNTVKWEPK